MQYRLGAGVRWFMDEVHAEGQAPVRRRAQPDDEVAAVDGGLAGVDGILADLWG